MATTKKTTTAKKTAPKKKAVRPAEVTEQLELPSRPDPVQETEPYVEYIIPRRPGFEDVDQFFEYCRNGIVYRFRRGVLLRHPESLYRAVMRKVEASDRISESAAPFLNMKKLN